MEPPLTWLPPGPARGPGKGFHGLTVSSRLHAKLSPLVLGTPILRGGPRQAPVSRLPFHEPKRFVP